MTKYLCLLAIAISAGAPASAATPQADVLERVGKGVEKSWDDFAAVACTEELMQEKFNDKGKVALRSESKYDYLIVLAWDKGQILVDESRIESNPQRKSRPKGALLTTRGFAMLLFIFHPEYRDSYAFSKPVEENGLLRIDFLPRPGSASPSVMELKDRQYPVEWEGTAWIDPKSATITRIDAKWKEPPAAIGLRLLHADVHYGAVALESAKNYWLPQTADIELQSLHQSWRNQHRFTAYRHFSVDVRDKTAEVKDPDSTGEPK